MAVKQGTAPTILTIVGKDLDIGNTFNSEFAAGTPALVAGTLVLYDEAAMLFSKWAPGGDVFGLLAHDMDASTSTVPVPALVYRTGTFLRQEVETANGVLIPPNSADDKALRDKGIYLEWSYMDYIGIPNPPAGAPPEVKG